MKGKEENTIMKSYCVGRRSYTGKGCGTDGRDGRVGGVNERVGNKSKP